MTRLVERRSLLRPVVPLVALALLVLGAASCSGSDEQASAPKPTTSASAAGTAEKEDGCARVISAIGWTEFMLVRPGHESEQDFQSGVRGRLAYVEGTVKMFGEYLPSQAVRPAKDLQRQAHRIVDLDASRAEQVAGLKDYRKAVRDVERACSSSADG